MEKIEQLSEMELAALLEQHPNDRYAALNPREYLDARIKLLKEAGAIKSSNALSVMCGFHASAIYNLHGKIRERNPNRKPPTPTWKQATIMHHVTHGFISIQYTFPEFSRWSGMIAAVAIDYQTAENKHGV